MLVPPPVGDQPAQAKMYLYIRASQVYADTISVLIHAPNGNVEFTSVMSKPEDFVAIEGSSNFIQSLATLAMSLHYEGVYWFEALYRNKRIGLAPLEVKWITEGNDDEK